MQSYVSHATILCVPTGFENAGFCWLNMTVFCVPPQSGNSCDIPVIYSLVGFLAATVSRANRRLRRVRRKKLLRIAVPPQAAGQAPVAAKRAIRLHCRHEPSCSGDDLSGAEAQLQNSDNRVEGQDWSGQTFRGRTSGARYWSV